MQRQECASYETLQKVQERRKRKSVVNNSRTRAGKMAAQERRKSIRGDKKRFIEGLAQGAEGAAAKGHMKELHDTSIKVIGGYEQSADPIKNKEGSLLTNSDDQLKRWAEHFQELLNRPASPDQLQRQILRLAETDQAGERLREPLVS